MRLKKLGAALVVVVALGAVLASSALAAATTTDVQWYTGVSPGTLLSGSEQVVSTQIGTNTFTTEVGTTKYELRSTGIDCVSCKIENSGGKAVGSGTLEFTGVTVTQPAGCFVTGGKITTTALTVQPDWMIGTANYWKFTPTAGETTKFATIPVEGCALSTSLVPKGSVFVQTQKATGIQVIEPEVHGSDIINSTAGGSLKVGTKNAVLNSDLAFEMAGAKLGLAFGTH